jgi:hypothetical protein
MLSHREHLTAGECIPRPFFRLKGADLIFVHIGFAIFTFVPLFAMYAEKRYEAMGGVVLMAALWLIVYLLARKPRMPRVLTVDADEPAPVQPPPPTGKMRVTLGTKPITREEYVKSKFQGRGTVTEYHVRLNVEISEEQRTILSKYNLWDVTVLGIENYIAPDLSDAHPDIADEIPRAATYSMRDLLSPSGFSQAFPTPVDAKNFETKLRTETLPLIKQYIEDSGKVGPAATETFEL